MGLLTTGPNQPDINTIVCDGKDGVKVQYEDPLNSTCLKDCVFAHEEKHIQDVLAGHPDICKGKPELATIRMTRKEEKQYESAAYSISIECLRKKLESLESCHFYYNRIKWEIEFQEKKINGYK